MLAIVEATGSVLPDVQDKLLVCLEPWVDPFLGKIACPYAQRDGVLFHDVGDTAAWSRDLLECQGGYHQEDRVFLQLIYMCAWSQPS